MRVGGQGGLRWQWAGAGGVMRRCEAGEVASGEPRGAGELPWKCWVSGGGVVVRRGGGVFAGGGGEGVWGGGR